MRVHKFSGLLHIITVLFLVFYSLPSDAQLTETQASALMKAATEDSDPRLSLFVAFGLNAAMRHSEIVASRYDQIDFDNRRIFIPLAKAGEREQPVTQALASLLLRQQRC
ncbi:MAG: hypothetical protein EOO02_09195, partial [Chitinophagaceae bacterium]